MIVIDFLLYSFYRFCNAIRTQIPRIEALYSLGFVFTFLLLYVCELIAKYVFDYPLKDNILNYVWVAFIIFYLIVFFLSIRAGKSGCKLKKLDERFNNKTFHKTWFYVSVSLGLSIGTLLLGLFLHLYIL